MVHGAGIGIRNPASAVKDAAVTAAHWKTHEEEDENAAVEGAHRAELVGESLARKSIYMRERLKGRREESRRLKESVLDEAERSRLIFETAYGNEAKDAVKREAEKNQKMLLWPYSWSRGGKTGAERRIRGDPLPADRLRQHGLLAGSCKMNIL